MKEPLAEVMRPKNIEDVIGQQHVLGKGKMLTRIVASSVLPNLIFFGPPGVGKTTVANIIAQNTNRKFYKLNATNASVSDIKTIIEDLDTLLTMNGVVLYLDEIQNFNKKQQQSLLEYTENGKITLIASTTENPYFYVYNALLSRSTVVEFKPLSLEDIKQGIKKAINYLEKELNQTEICVSEEVLNYIAISSNGDMRKGINTLQLAVTTTGKNKDGIIEILLEDIESCISGTGFNYDKFGDNHYDTLSAFQKSIRGSDVNAAVHYLARLIKAGDLISICRRLLVIASEDIGLAYPNAVAIVKSCVDSAFQLGLPEARIPLSQAVILLATSPKSNSAYIAIDKALMDLNNKEVGEIPTYLKDAHYGGAKKLKRGEGYKYPHDYKNNYVTQQYLPDKLKNSKYYIPSENKMENAIKSYLEFLENNK